MFDFDKKIIMFLLISASIRSSEQNVKQSDEGIQVYEQIRATIPSRLDNSNFIKPRPTTGSKDTTDAKDKAHAELKKSLSQRELFMQQFLKEYTK